MASIKEKVEEVLPQDLASLVSGYAFVGPHPICALVENAFEQCVWCGQVVQTKLTVVVDLDFDGDGHKAYVACCDCATKYDL
jgi:hypothetical protein